MSLAIAITAIAILIIALAFVGAFVDRHLGVRAQVEAERLRVHVLELESTKENLEKTTKNLTAALAAAAQSSEAKSQFLAAMSHELRTPLNAIIGYSEIMRSEVYGAIGNPRYAQYLSDIHASGSHLLSLINDVLDLARLDANHLAIEAEQIDLRALIAETMRGVTPQAGQGKLRLDYRVADDLPPVSADRRRLKQVLLNLLSNAVKFTPPGGHILVTATSGRDGIAIAISDTGIGMRSEDIPIALQRFGQVDAALSRKYEGTGLGLPLSKQLIELHDGRLDIESSIGVGTTVTVRLPTTRARLSEQADTGVWPANTDSGQLSHVG